MKSTKFIQRKLEELELIDYDIYDVISTYIEILTNNLSSSDKQRVEEEFNEFYEDKYSEDEPDDAEYDDEC